MNTCLILNDSRDTAVYIYRYKALWMATKELKLLIVQLIFNLMFNLQIWYAETTNLLHFTVYLLHGAESFLRS